MLTADNARNMVTSAQSDYPYNIKYCLALIAYTASLGHRSVEVSDKNLPVEDASPRDICEFLSRLGYNCNIENATVWNIINISW